MASGIRHLCDEKIKDTEFQYFLDSLESFQVTEKIDGTNLTFGLDSSGNFYINRDKKDGRKFGNIYPNNKYLLGPTFSKYFDILFKFAQTGAIRMTRDSAFEVEIIDDAITNVVPYDPHQIIILDAIAGHLDIYKEEIEVIKDGGQTWTIKFNKPYKVDIGLVRNIFKGRTKDEALVELKKQLLDIPSQYGSNNPNSWIEGLVFRKENLIYKLVNRDRFTVMNKFLHETRAMISAPKPGLNSKGGLYQEMVAEIAKFYDCEMVATSQRKRWLSNNPSWADEIGIKDQLFYNQNVIMVVGIIKNYSKMLSDMEADYKQNYNTKFIDTPYGKCFIDQYTHAKNLSLFKTTEIKISEILHDIQSSSASREVGLQAIRW